MTCVPRCVSQAYERLLRAGATSEITDGKGRYPVELAPPEVRDDFVALEARYAGKSGRKSKGKKAKTKAKTKIHASPKL